MKNKVLGCFMILLYGVAANAETARETGETQSGFQYNEDWQYVSAPPPPGPYQSVTLDPQVPGQKFVLPLSQPVTSVLPDSNGQLVPDPLRDHSRQPDSVATQTLQSATHFPPEQAQPSDLGQQSESGYFPPWPPGWRPFVPLYNYPYPPYYPVAPGYVPGYVQGYRYRYPVMPPGPYGYQGGPPAYGHQDIPPPGSVSQ